MIVVAVTVIVLSCSDDPTEPVIVDIGGTMEVAHITPAEGNAITISGDSTDDANLWSRAEELIVQVRDSLDRMAVVRMKGLTDSTNFYLLAKWRDDTRDVMPDYWLFNDSLGGHIRTSNLPLTGGQDFFVAMFSEGSLADEDSLCWRMCHYRDPGPESIMRNEGTSMVDAWIWKAGQTDPIRTLRDIYYPVADTFHLDQMADRAVPIWRENILSNDIRWMHIDSLFYDGEFLFWSETIDWRLSFQDDEGKLLLWPKGAVIPGYVLADSVIYYANESSWEIEAKGSHDEIEGFWVLELKRRLDTGFADDIQFVLGQKVLSTIGIKDSPGANSPDPHLGSGPFEIQF